MALINCPECGKEISDKSKVCIHCGFPLKSDTICNINGIECDLGFIFDEKLGKVDAACRIKELTNCHMFDAFDIACDIINTQTIPKYLTIKPNEEGDKTKSVKCPYCNSINTKKISGASKAGKVAVFGVFALGKVNKQWHCNSCGSDF